MFYDQSLLPPLPLSLSSPHASFHALTIITHTATDGKVDGITNCVGAFTPQAWHIASIIQSDRTSLSSVL